MTAKIEIKGIAEGLLITLKEGLWPDQRQALIEHLDQQGDFLKGGRLILDIGNQILKAADLGELRDHISERGLTLWAVLSNSPTTELTAQSLGLATRITKARPERETRPLVASVQSQEALLVQQTLRSGHRIEYPGHIVVIGDVNPGAEIVAGGHVIIWGRLRGTVHAGAGGDKLARVFALDLSPTQLRIAEIVSITPASKRSPRPEVAYLQNGQVIAESWDTR
ncbi:MAG: septum site-determining protein MinC [Anaerolineales bacterium]|nr:septum site-determining protein MinC [Anaerolineales bacterium]